MVFNKVVYLTKIKNNKVFVICCLKIISKNPKYIELDFNNKNQSNYLLEFISTNRKIYKLDNWYMDDKNFINEKLQYLEFKVEFQRILKNFK